MGTRAGNHSTGLPPPPASTLMGRLSHGRPAFLVCHHPDTWASTCRVKQDHSLGTCLVPCPPGSTTLAQVFLIGNLHQTGNKKKQQDRVLFIVYKVLSYACIPLCPMSSLGGGRDYNHLRSEMRNLGTWKEDAGCLSILARQRW